jgi:WD40 repeat protein
VLGLAFSPDGKLLASASRDRSIRVWDVKSQKQAYELIGHRGAVSSVAFSPDGKLLVSAGADGQVNVWIAEPDPVILPFRLAQDTVTFSPDGKMLAIHVLDFSEGGTPDGSHLAILEMESGRIIGTIPGPSNLSQTYPPFTWSADGKLLARGRDDGIVELWSIESHSKVRELTGLDLGKELSSHIIKLSFSPDGTDVAAANANLHFRMWNVASGATIMYSGLNTVRDFAFHPYGRSICTLDYYSKLTCKKLGQLNSEVIFEVSDQQLSSPIFSSDGRYLSASTSVPTQPGADAPGSKQFVSTIWDFPNHSAAKVLQGHVQEIRSLSFSPDNKTLATGDDGGTVKLWSTSTGQELLSLQAYESRTGVRVLFSPDGKYLVTVALFQARLWQATAPDRAVHGNH